MKEMKHYFMITYDGKVVKVISAHSKWEAVDRVAFQYNHLDRKRFKATKCNPKFN